MEKNSNKDPLAEALRALRGNDYKNAVAVVSYTLDLDNNELDIFRLKVLLIRAATEHWPGVKELDMVLVALGLLDGYYYDANCIDSLSEVAPCAPSDDSEFSEVSLIHQADAIIPPVEEIFPTGKEIILTPGEKFELKVAVLPIEAANVPLSYVSLDTNIRPLAKIRYYGKIGA